MSMLAALSGPFRTLAVGGVLVAVTVFAPSATAAPERWNHTKTLTYRTCAAELPYC